MTAPSLTQAAVTRRSVNDSSTSRSPIQLTRAALIEQIHDNKNTVDRQAIKIKPPRSMRCLNPENHVNLISSSRHQRES